MTDKAWMQFLLVAMPVLSLIGAWLALRAAGGRRGGGESGGGRERCARTEARDR
jgi:hypothetical protein